MNNVLDISRLSKDYDDFRLKDISFSLPEGYIMGLIGPNGAGKTTTIKLIMNLIRRSGGSIKVFGRDLIAHEVEIKSRIGFVYDNPNYYEHLNLRQLKGIIAPFYKTWDEAAFLRLVKQFGLPLNKALKNFSRGMVMKAAIAIALSHQADFIIMDEPTSGLDPVFRRELLELLHEQLQNESRSILFSTHITSDIERIADFITFILDGEIVFSSRKDDILDSYALVKGGRELLNGESQALFKGIRKTEFGFEALTDNVRQVKQRWGAEVVIDRASLEDIMYFFNLRNQHA